MIVLLVGGIVVRSIAVLMTVNASEWADGGARSGPPDDADGPTEGDGRDRQRHLRNPDVVHGVPIDVLDRVLMRVSVHEGGVNSLNLNRDGTGLSMGILQWSQRPEQLGVLLTALAKADPSRLVALFGASWRELLIATGTGSLEQVDGAVLWREPWVTRF